MSKLALPLTLLFAGLLHASAGELAYDHYHPFVLNEFAMKKIREDDLGTARILLERAAQLAPHDQRIRQNLQILRDWQSGEPAPAGMSAVPDPAVAIQPEGDRIDPEFPLWRKE